MVVHGTSLVSGRVLGDVHTRTTALHSAVPRFPHPKVPLSTRPFGSLTPYNICHKLHLAMIVQEDIRNSIESRVYLSDYLI
jgi:hypothetical protein